MTVQSNLNDQDEERESNTATFKIRNHRNKTIPLPSNILVMFQIEYLYINVLYV